MMLLMSFLNCSHITPRRVETKPRPTPAKIKVDVLCQYPDGFFKIVTRNEICTHTTVVAIIDKDVFKVFNNWYEANAYIDYLQSLGSFKR